MDPRPRTDDPWSLSQFFTVRVWYDEAGTSEQEIRIQVRHVLSGATQYFNNWRSLIEYVLAKLDASLPTTEE